MNTFIQTLESRTFLSATVFSETFDSPTGTAGTVLFKADPIYSATASPTGGNATGNKPYLDGLIIKNDSVPPFTTEGFGVIGHDQGGSGYFLFEGTNNGSASSYVGKVWESNSTVKVTSNTNYLFSFYLVNPSNQHNAIIEPFINGKSVGTGVSAKGYFTDGSAADQWQKFSFSWNSGTATTADLSLMNEQSVGGGAGDDFGIDTIALTSVTLPASKLAIVQQPTSALVGSAISKSFIVDVKDSAGDVVSGDASTVKLAIASGPSGGGITGTTSATAVHGVATLGNLVFTKAGTYTLKASDGSLTSVTSASITVTTPVGSISGVVFGDTNANGKIDKGEVGLGLFTVYLDINNDGKLDTGDKSVTTDIHGNFSFTGLAAGTYYLRIVPDTVDTATTPTLIKVVLSAGQISTGNLFGEN